MSNFPSYPTRSFSETQKFFVLDPQTGTPSFVPGSDLVNFLTPGTSFVFSESTRVSAQASNYKVGNLIQTAGAVTEGDGLASGFLVVPGGEGDFAMQNGNDLLVIRGDDLLREQLKEGVVRMPDLAAMESTSGRFDGDAARLVSGTGRDGDFRWDSSDLSSTLVLASATSDSVDDTTDTINDADHPFSDGDGVITQTTVNGLTAHTVYWVVNSTSGTYQLSATFGGGAVDLTGTTNVTIDHLLDPRQGIYVTPAADKTGAGGAWERALDGDPDARMFGYSNGDTISGIQDFMQFTGGLSVTDALNFSSDETITQSGARLYGDGSLTALPGSGASIVFQGDGSSIDLKVYGNENKAAVVQAVSASPDVITVDGALDFSVGDGLIIKSSDGFSRVLWAGNITSFAGNDLTVSTNAIDGDFANVAIGQTIHINESSNYHGFVKFSDLDHARVGDRFSGSSRDLRFENVNHVVHGNLRLDRAGVYYLFCFDIVGGAVSADNPHFYGRSVQGCRQVSLGDAISRDSLFTGQVLKGVHEAVLGGCASYNSPIMGLQVVEYPGSVPNTINPNLQADVVSRDVKIGDLYMDSGNFCCSIKSVDGLRLGDVVERRCYKSFFVDVAWSNVTLNSFSSFEHNAGGGNAFTSGAALWAQNGENFKVTGDLVVVGCESSSGSGCVFIDSVSGSVDIQGLSLENSEEFARIVSSGDVRIGEFRTADNVDGFQLLTLDGNQSVKVLGVESRESVNSSMDRVINNANGGNVKIQNARGYFSGSASPTDFIRDQSSDTAIEYESVYSEGSTNCVRITGASDHVTVSKAVAGSGTTNAVLLDNITDYLTVIACQGTIVDNTTAPNKTIVATNLA